MATTVIGRPAGSPRGDLLGVDDDRDMAELAADALRSEGYAVRVASDGMHALRLLEDALPQLVLLDVEMPELSGPGLALRMLVHDCGAEEIPIVLASGIDGLGELAATVGTPYLLSKPYTCKALLTLVDRALRERRAPRLPGLVESRP